VDGLVYLLREDGVLICVDAKTGQEHYSERTTPDRHRASPVYADGYLYTTARNGKISVIRAGKEMVSEAVNDMGEEISASPAISGGKIYIRTFKNLYAIGK